MGDFEEEYAEELEMMDKDGDLLPGPPSRRSLDLRSPCLQSRKRPLSSESPLQTISPGHPCKFQCLPRHQHTSTESLPIAQPPVTPSRPAVAFGGGFTNSLRSIDTVQLSSVATTDSDIPYDSMPTPPSPPHSPTSPQSSVTDVQLRQRKTPDGTILHTSSCTSKYQQMLDVGLSLSPHDSKIPRSSIIDRFDAVYQSLTMQPTTEELEGELHDDSCIPVLDSRKNCPIVADAPLSSGAMRRAPVGPYITVTSSDGRRVYLKLRNSQPLPGRYVGSSSSSHLLPVSFSQLRAAVQAEKRRKLIEQSEELLSMTSDVESQLLFGDTEALDAVNDDEPPNSTSHSLWVDKYAPRHYTHLLSDDGINRTLLSWMKLWDETVFGQSSLSSTSSISRPGRLSRDKTSKKNDAGLDSGRAGRVVLHTGKNEWRELGDPATFANEEALDESRRPRLKLSLLCGAPGLGKTTLAHIIAHHAGYHVVEMNASDDRSADVFRQKLEATTQMQPVLTPDCRPTCLIIDEIDGAPTAAINVLIELVKRKDVGKKKKKKQRALSRPVICICNDQYAPSLRQLKQFALVLVFPPTLASRLASRLQQVVRHERMISSISTLMALCEKADNDIRACLNTLQFINRQKKELTVSVVQNASVGQKDAQMSLFSLWKLIFQLPSAKRHPVRCGINVKDVALQGGNRMNANATRFHHLLLAASSTGEYDKICHGLFENYLNIRFKDPNLEAICAGLDWIVFHDNLQQHIAHTQNFSFWPYLPFLSVAFHFLFAAPSKPYIRYPHTNYEMFQKKQQCKHLLSSVMIEVPPHIHRMLTSTQLAIDMLCPILEIITPTFRPVSTQLYTAREKQQLADLVDTMISYGLTYKQEKGPDGQYTYVIDPCLEDVCRFPGLAQRKQLSYSAKQLIAREVDVEKMRRTEGVLSEHNSSSTKPCSDDWTAKQISATKKVIEKGHLRTMKQVLPVKDKPAMDFFGRRVQSTNNKGGASYSHTQHPLWFKFNEGFSNAVRRPVRIQDLL